MGIRLMVGLDTPLGTERHWEVAIEMMGSRPMVGKRM